ncbi:RPC19, partial [Fragariocoptes setiger]
KFVTIQVMAIRPATDLNRFGVLSIEDDGKCANFEFLDEDHTLGNALRHMLLKDVEVRFCGYASPHPNERRITFQVQVYKGTAIDALERGLRNLRDLNSHVKSVLSKEYQAIQNSGCP